MNIRIVLILLGTQYYLSTINTIYWLVYELLRFRNYSAYYGYRSEFFIFLIELYKMVCEPDETDLDIHIPAVMLPQDAGSSLEKLLNERTKGKL